MFLLYIISVVLISTCVCQNTTIPIASISSHVLDISIGIPAADVQILAYRQNTQGWLKIGSQFTGQDGRVPWVSPNVPLIPGIYRLVFLTSDYFKSRQQPSFYPYIELIFEIIDATQHYHVPITLSQFGYSTYRGS